MSLYIIAERLGSPNRIIRMRTLSAHIGEDLQGRLSCESPSKTYFSVFCVDTRYLCQIHDASFQLYQTGDPSLGGWITAGSKVCGNDYCFQFFLTDVLSEVLSGSDSSIPEILDEIDSAETVPTLQVNVANLSRTYPLPIALQLSIGSAPSSTIFVPVPAIAAKHCFVRTVNNNVIELTPVDGTLQLGPYAVNGAVSIASNQSVLLEPGGLNVEFRFPRSDSNINEIR